MEGVLDFDMKEVGHTLGREEEAEGSGLLTRRGALAGAIGIAGGLLAADIATGRKVFLGAIQSALAARAARAQDGSKAEPPSTLPGKLADTTEPGPKTGKKAAKPEAAGAEKKEEEGVPKDPPVLSWKVRVTIAKKERVVNLTRSDDGKKTKVEFEGYGKDDDPVFELPVRLPVDTSEKEKGALYALLGKAITHFYKAGDAKKIALRLESGKIKSTIDPKTIDWEVLVEQNDEFVPGKIMSTRLVNDGASTIAIVADKEGGHVVRVREDLPHNIDPSNIAHKVHLRRIYFGVSALVGRGGKDTFEERRRYGEGERDEPGFEPRYRVVRHGKKEDKVSTKSPDIKKE